MISENKERIQITLSKNQIEWLENMCKKAGISKSKYISWILSKKADELLKLLKLNTHFGNYSEEEIEHLINIKWIDED